MEELQLPDKTTPDMERFFKQLFGAAQGSLIELRSVPTGNALLPGQTGVYGTDIYIVTPGSGTKIKLTGSSWS